jgi:hypothetical protein
MVTLSFLLSFEKWIRFAYADFDYQEMVKCQKENLLSFGFSWKASNPSVMLTADVVYSAEFLISFRGKLSTNQKLTGE